jgi:prophage antirepressor-like protein
MFHAGDVCGILGYSNDSKAIKDHCKEGGVTIRYLTDSLGREQGNKFINESNLYRLIARSKMPNAEKFQDWVFDEVLPSIRKHGAYMTPEVIEKTFADPDFIIRLATQLKEEKTARTLAEARAQALLLTNGEQERELKAQAPKVAYHDDCLNSEDLVTVNTIAADLKMSAIKLNKILVNAKVVYKEGKTYQPYQKYRPLDLFKHKTVPYIGSDGEKKTREHLYVTQKGKKFIWEMLGKSNPGESLFARQEAAQ